MLSYRIDVQRGQCMSFDHVKDTTAPQRMLTVSEVAYLLHVHPNTVRLWSDNGLIRAYRVGHRRDRRFKTEDIDIFLTNNGDHTG